MSIFVVNDYIWLATYQSKIYEKLPPPPSKVAKSAFMGSLFEQPPQAQIRPKAKYLCAHQIANDKVGWLKKAKNHGIMPSFWHFGLG